MSKPPTAKSFEEELSHILHSCSCDYLDMNCWYMRSNDPDFLHTLPSRQALATRQLVADVIVREDVYDTWTTNKEAIAFAQGMNELKRQQIRDLNWKSEEPVERLALYGHQDKDTE